MKDRGSSMPMPETAELEVVDNGGDILFKVGLLVAIVCEFDALDVSMI